MKLHYDKMDELLIKGGNPNVYISGSCPPDATQILMEEGACLYADAGERVCDAFDSDRIGDIWKSVMEGTEYEIGEREVVGLFQGAAYQIVVNRLRDFMKYE